MILKVKLPVHTCQYADTREIEAFEAGCLFANWDMSRSLRRDKDQDRGCNQHAYYCDEIKHPGPGRKGDEQCADD